MSKKPKRLELWRIWAAAGSPGERAAAKRAAAAAHGAGILVGTPTLRTCDAGMMSSMVGGFSCLGDALSRSGASPSRHPLHFASASGALLPDSREELVELAIEARVAMLVMVDSDMVFSPSEFANFVMNAYAMRSAGLPHRGAGPAVFRITIAPYPMQGPEAALSVVPLEGHDLLHLAAPPLSVREVKEGGFGLVAVLVAGLALLEPPRFARLPAGRRYVGEDLSLCRKFRKEGGVVYANFRCQPGHRVAETRRLDWWLSREKIAREAAAAKRILRGKPGDDEGKAAKRILRGKPGDDEGRAAKRILDGKPGDDEGRAAKRTLDGDHIATGGAS